MNGWGGINMMMGLMMNWWSGMVLGLVMVMGVFLGLRRICERFGGDAGRYTSGRAGYSSFSSH